MRTSWWRNLKEKNRLNAARNGRILVFICIYVLMMNIIREILERRDYFSLIEEGRDPVEVLHYKYQDVPSDIIDQVIEVDPTKKKSYSQWLLSKWDDESNEIVHNLDNGKIESVFQYFKEHPEIQIKDCPSVRKALSYVPGEEGVLEKSSRPTTLLMNNGWTKEVDSDLANDFDVVFNEDNWVIAVPNTYEAECKLGENMYWCTAGGRGTYDSGRSYYNRYLDEYGGKYYVNFDMTRGESRLGKQYPFMRYQFHFESNQFMDKNDDPVELGEIDMPQSAMDYYMNEGYDTDNFLSLEERMEVYEEQRWRWCVQLNEELYLGIAYDEDFEFTEPDASTSFYVFSMDDDRDPISWEEVPNPHTNQNVILKEGDGYFILKASYPEDDVLLVIQETDTSTRWNRTAWEVYELNKYMEIPDYGVFGTTYDNKRMSYSLFTDYGEYTDKKVVFQGECEGMFINKYCTQADADEWERTFIETVNEGYHTLFAVSVEGGGYNFECLIKRDVPANNQYFVISEDGYIYGEFRKYEAYDEYNPNGNNDLEQRYNLEKKLENGDYAISMMIDGKEMQNIMRASDRQLVLDGWVDSVEGILGNLYTVKKNGKVGCFRQDGQQVGTWYSVVGNVDADKGIIGGKDDNAHIFHIINAIGGEVFAQFKGYVGSPKNNKLVVICDDGQQRCYDYIKREFCYPEFESFVRIFPYNNRYFYCKLNGRDDAVIFNFDQQQVLATGVTNVSKLDRYGELLDLTKITGKHNVFGQRDRNTETEYYEMLPTDVDGIVWTEPIQGIITYMLNGRYFAYSYSNNQILVNQNGTDIKPFPDGYGYLSYAAEGNEGSHIYISFYNNKLKWWYRNSPTGNYLGGNDRIDDNTPQDVRNLYAAVTGQQSAVSEQFRAMMKRLNEAGRLHRVNVFFD